jgi:hypothetical protein
MLRKYLSVCLFAVLAVCTSTFASGQTLDNRTYFTFDQPVALPGVTLPPGKYLFRIVDSTSSRRIVQVLDADGRKPYAMLMSIPAQRSDAPSSPEVRFMETPVNTPTALKTWWYPGTSIGYEFVYPKEQALRLAKNASGPVLTTKAAESDTTEEMKGADLARVSSTGAETAVSVEASPTAGQVAGAGRTGEVAAASLDIAPAATPLVPIPVAPVAPAATATGAASTRAELPRTGSTLPLTMALGVISLLAGVALAGPRVRL